MFWLRSPRSEPAQSSARKALPAPNSRDCSREPKFGSKHTVRHRGPQKPSLPHAVTSRSRPTGSPRQPRPPPARALGGGCVVVGILGWTIEAHEITAALEPGDWFIAQRWGAFHHGRSRTRTIEAARQPKRPGESSPTGFRPTSRLPTERRGRNTICTETLGAASNRDQYSATSFIVRNRSSIWGRMAFSRIGW
jgi:hypothetical protein